MTASTRTCPLCAAPAPHFTDVEGQSYFRCSSCRSIFIEPGVLDALDSGQSIVRDYGDDYWDMELRAARVRASGGSLCRAGEAILYCRRPVERFLDIGAGPGFLLDGLSARLDPDANIFHGVEKFPPEVASRHPNYHVGTLSDLRMRFDAGVCIEVIEHLTPSMLRDLVSGLARASLPGSYWLFNTGMDGYVEHEDPGYLDPYRRGHIISWSLAGLRTIFEPAGFTIEALPGKSFAFAAEFAPAPGKPYGERIYQPLPENRALLERDPLLYCAAFESARSYFYAQGYRERTAWALSLDSQLKALRAPRAPGGPTEPQR